MGMHTNQKYFYFLDDKATYHFKLFIFYYFFVFPFSLRPIFLLQLLAFYQASFEWKNIQESINEARNTCHGQAEGRKRKFSSEFFTQLKSILVHISSCINPVTLVVVTLERSRPASQIEHECCLS